ncbi:hypothetical protein HMPREF2708_00970 [Corynebacterium sp. HMSC073H12]|uniref:hypothetical protein n=1 Tax=Corynebacterium sp. HMSC073H12 TaxID=1715187 RepID=UPI0008A850F3|nr:hypothetical protein [Corynebacterium sp. HMSC073H12]OHQ78172.1 hypothetical protein HMPREF2708_00970 [Corynebacterium sp. HMSC073H12]
MSGIDLYAVFAVDPSQPGAVVANKIQQQINSTNPQSWDAEKKELADYAVAIFGDESKKQRYDQALQSPFSPPEVTTDFLADLATTRSSQGRAALRQGGVDAPRGRSAVGDMTPTVSSESHNSVIMRTVTTTFAPVQPLAPEATLKDVWVRTPKTIQAAIVTLAGLAVFSIGEGVFTFVQILEIYESTWRRFLYLIIDSFSQLAILGTIALTLVSGFAVAGMYRRLKISLLTTVALVPGLRLIGDIVDFVLNEFTWVGGYFELNYWWEFTCYFGLSILALVLCLLPQSLAWYRGMTLVKTTSQGS